MEDVFPPRGSEIHLPPSATLRTDVNSCSLPNNLKTEALIVLEDKIREDAIEIINSFKNEKVSIKIISGDNVETIKNIAESIGLSGNVVDASKLPDIIDNVEELVERTVAFGRTSPEQKQQIIKALQKNGHIVAMTGDGINDILALKRSDCGIAMGSGSDATKAVSKFVLLDSKFSSLPEIVKQGRRVINNISRVASLFIVKTTYSLLLSLASSIAKMPYPYLPIQMAVVSITAVGIPSFLLALEPNYEKVKGSLIKKIVYNSIPSGVMIALLVFCVSQFKEYIYTGLAVFGVLNITDTEVATIIIIIMGMIQMWTLLDISKPLTLYRKCVIIGVFILFNVGIFIGGISKFFNLIPLRIELYVTAVVASAIAIFIIWIVKKILRKIMIKSVKQ